MRGGLQVDFNYSKLKGLIRERELTQENVAEEIGISSATFNLKINGKAFFTQDEIFKTSIRKE